MASLTLVSITCPSIADCEGIAALSAAFLSNPSFQHSLTKLDFSNNKLGTESSQELAKWLSSGVSLQHLSLNNTSPEFDAILGGITKGVGVYSISSYWIVSTHCHSGVCIQSYCFKIHGSFHQVFVEQCIHQET